MWSEIDQLAAQCEEELYSLKRQIQTARKNPFLRFNAKGYIMKAEEKVQQIQELLVKLEGLSEQVMPVVNDLKNIVGLQIKQNDN